MKNKLTFDPSLHEVLHLPGGGVPHHLQHQVPGGGPAGEQRQGMGFSGWTGNLYFNAPYLEPLSRGSVMKAEQLWVEEVILQLAGQAGQEEGKHVHCWPSFLKKISWC